MKNFVYCISFANLAAFAMGYAYFAVPTVETVWIFNGILAIFIFLLAMDMK